MNINISHLEVDWYPRALASCSILKIFGLWLLIVMILGILSNSYIIYLYCKHKELQIPTNRFIIIIAICDLVSCLIELPLPMIANFSCRWIFGKIGCYYEAFIAYFVGASSVFLLCSISIDRYLAIVKPFQYRSLSSRWQHSFVSLGCLLFALFWAIIPLSGWSGYDLEGALTSCSVKWQDGTWQVTSYNLLMFLFVFFMPLTIMTCCNLSTYMAIRNIGEHTYWRDDDPHTQHQLQIEKKVAKTAVMIIFTFLISWTPYAIVGLISINGKAHTINPLAATIPALFAKSKVIWNPLVYVICNRNFNVKIPIMRKTKAYDSTIQLKNYFP